MARLLPSPAAEEVGGIVAYAERDAPKKRANLAMLAFDIESSDLRLNEARPLGGPSAIVAWCSPTACRLSMKNPPTEIGTITDASQVTQQ